jgi:hypothetical protein
MGDSAKNIKTLIVGGYRDMCDEYLIYIVVGVEICMLVLNCSFESNIIKIEFAFVIQVGSQDIGLCQKCKISVSLTRQGFR